MTEILKRALEKASQELPDYEQDEIGRWLFDAISRDDTRWDEAFAQTKDKLARLAKRALAAFGSGQTESLDPDKL